MIRHVALFRFADSVTDETITHIDDTLATLPGLIPDIISFRFGRDIGLTDGAWDYAVTTDLASADDYHTYATHPDHVAIVRNIVGPHVTESARVQFEVG